MKFKRNSVLIPVESLLRSLPREIIAVYREAARCVEEGLDVYVALEPTRVTTWYRARKVWVVAGIGSLFLDERCSGHVGLDNMPTILDDAWGDGMPLEPFFRPESRGPPRILASQLGFRGSGEALCVLGEEPGYSQGRGAFWSDCPAGEGRLEGVAVPRASPLLLPINHLVGTRLVASPCPCRPAGLPAMLKIGASPIIYGDEQTREIHLCCILRSDTYDLVTRVFSLVWACGG